MNTPQAWSERSAVETPWEAACWSYTGQKSRFEAVLRHLDLADGDTLLDYGCGTGFFSEFLPPTIAYFAYDWAEGMRERVRSTYERVWVFDEMPDMAFDHVVCIGTFNLSENWSKEQTWDTLEWLWTLTRKSLIVCLYCGDDPVCLHYQPEEVLGFSTKFAIDHTYLPNDLLLEMRA